MEEENQLDEPAWLLADLFRADPRMVGRIETEAESDCWVWTGARQKALQGGNQYGRLRRNGALWLVHRWVYELLTGEIPKGHQVHHLCKNTLCCNPRHLESIDSVAHTLQHNREDAEAAA